MPEIGDIVRASDLEANKPQLSIGTVTTGAAGTNASASISGTSPNFKLNLTIPRGNTGATGPRGPSGTYTGPLKPTSAYWRGADRVWISSSTTMQTKVPSGGTWAYFCQGVRMGIAAGGTLLKTTSYRPPTDAGEDDGVPDISYLCWRIQ